MATKDEVYLAFGKAAELAQLFEFELGTTIIYFEFIQDQTLDQSISAIKLREKQMRDKLDEKNLGAKLHAIKTNFKLKQNLKTIFFKALRHRNYLCHEFFSDHGMDIESDTGRDTMIWHLSQISSELVEALRLAGYLAEITVSAAKLLKRVHLKPTSQKP